MNGRRPRVRRFSTLELIGHIADLYVLRRRWAGWADR